MNRLHPILFKIGSFELPTYGVLLATALIAALDEACLDRLVEVLRRHAGPRIGVKLRLRDDSHAPPLQVTVDLQRRINLTPQAQQELSAVLSGFSLRRIGPGSALAAARHAAGP